ncbi:cryptococcal mannosyltransferase 1-domain-containing protein [Chaetomium sp. MPI-SDFR-AT-0129]|nr:cryptococcal mannosyltransferase 1-domain-containing protein [Chaetomium sp. MPI-SDFR-AT-0129]
MRRHFLLPAICLLVVTLTLYHRRSQVCCLQWPGVSPNHSNVKAAAPKPAPKPKKKSPTFLSKDTASIYVNSIIHPGSVDFPQLGLPLLECPKHHPTRYNHLKPTSPNTNTPKTTPTTTTIQYFFALDLRDSLPLLPRLLTTILQTIHFLGPSHCALSIVEGHSRDGTHEVLSALRPALKKLGIRYHFTTSPINPQSPNGRIPALADLRNVALQPLFDAASPSSSSPVTITPDTTILFLNDIAACPDDLLELIHQRRSLQADLVCGMDWTYAGGDGDGDGDAAASDPTFYDVWIARTLKSGDSFFEVPPDGSWDRAGDLFWNDEVARGRFERRQPFQVFSCWNGGVVFGAGPLLDGKKNGKGGEGGKKEGKGVRFRAAREGECHQGEPELFCKDLWYAGYGKIAVVPTVNFEYSNEAGKEIKEAKGYVSTWVGKKDWKDEGIEWQTEPPKEVKCMARYDAQVFEPWDKAQPGK